MHLAVTFFLHARILFKKQFSFNDLFLFCILLLLAKVQIAPERLFRNSSEQIRLLGVSQSLVRLVVQAVSRFSPLFRY